MDQLHKFLQLSQLEPWRRNELLESEALSDRAKRYSKEVFWTARFFIEQMLERFGPTDARVVQYTQIQVSLELAAAQMVAWRTAGWQLPSSLASTEEARQFVRKNRDDILACADLVVDFAIEHAEE